MCLSKAAEKLREGSRGSKLAFVQRWSSWQSLIVRNKILTRFIYTLMSFIRNQLTFSLFSDTTPCESNKLGGKNLLSPSLTESRFREIHAASPGGGRLRTQSASSSAVLGAVLDSREVGCVSHCVEQC